MQTIELAKACVTSYVVNARMSPFNPLDNLLPAERSRMQDALNAVEKDWKARKPKEYRKT